MELAVNIPEHEPHVGQAERSVWATSSSLIKSSAASIIASTKSNLRTFCPVSLVTSSCTVWLSPSVVAKTLPASMGPPETKIVGMFNRMAAISMPGVILSQLEIHTSASAQ